MAKSPRKNRRPSLFQSSQKTKNIMQSVGDALANGVLNSGMKEVMKEQPQDWSVERLPKYLKLTNERLNKLEVIDLKPFFAQSSHRRLKKDGGWYLVVPIKRKARDMSRRMYEQLRAIDISPDEQRTVISDYLYDRRRESDVTYLNYTPKSRTITKIRSGNNRHDYVAFRTVSDTSPMSSWIINRDKATVDNTSKTFISNVTRLMKWKMKNS